MNMTIAKTRITSTRSTPISDMWPLEKMPCRIALGKLVSHIGAHGIRGRIWLRGAVLRSCRVRAPDRLEMGAREPRHFGDGSRAFPPLLHLCVAGAVRALLCDGVGQREAQRGARGRA